MRAALIDTTGHVVNIIVVGDDYAPPESLTLVASDTAGVGDSYADGSFTQPPTPVLSLADLKAAKLAELSAACAAQIVSGYTSSALGAPHTYPSKATDQTNMLGSVLASLLPGLPANWTTPFWCADAVGVWAFQAHTAAQIQQAGADGKTAVALAQLKLATLSAEAMAAADAGAVAAIVW